MISMTFCVSTLGGGGVDSVELSFFLLSTTADMVVFVSMSMASALVVASPIRVVVVMGVAMFDIGVTIVGCSSGCIKYSF